jgi:hypothetical protein
MKNAKKVSKQAAMPCALPKKGPGIYKFTRNNVEFYEYWREVVNPTTNKKELKCLGITNVVALGQDGLESMKMFLDDAWQEKQPDELKKFVEDMKAKGIH